MMKPRIAFLLIALALSACGGKVAGHERSGIARGINEINGGIASLSPSVPGRASTTSPSPTATQSARTSVPKSEVRLPENVPQYAKGTQHAPLTAEMSACVAQSRTQRLTVRSAPGLQVSWGTLWADGEPHRDWTAFGVGVVPPTGVYTATFLVPADAPLGETRTDLTVAGQMNGKDATAYDHVYWTVAKAC